MDVFGIVYQVTQGHAQRSHFFLNPSWGRSHRRGVEDDAAKAKLRGSGRDIRAKAVGDDDFDVGQSWERVEVLMKLGFDEVPAAVGAGTPRFPYARRAIA